MSHATRSTRPTSDLTLFDLVPAGIVSTQERAVIAAQLRALYLAEQQAALAAQGVSRRRR